MQNPMRKVEAGDKFVFIYSYGGLGSESNPEPVWHLAMGTWMAGNWVGPMAQLGSHTSMERVEAAIDALAEQARALLDVSV